MQRNHAAEQGRDVSTPSTTGDQVDKATAEYIAELAEAANPGARIVTVDAEPNHVYYVENEKGELEKVHADRKPDNHEAFDLAGLCKITTDHADRYTTKPQIWYSRHGATAVMCPELPHDRAFLTLTPSPQLARLMEWDRAGGAVLDQSKLVLILRTLFAGCCDKAVIEAVRNIQTRRNADISSQVAQGKASVGRSMIAEMTGANGVAVFESITLYVPVFAQAAVPVSELVRVEIDPDPINERFTLVVRPGDIERAQADAEEALAERIAKILGAESTIPIYRGKP